MSNITNLISISSNILPESPMLQFGLIAAGATLAYGCLFWKIAASQRKSPLSSLESRVSNPKITPSSTTRSPIVTKRSPIVEDNSVNFADFQPINDWEIEAKGEQFDSGVPMYIIDKTTGRRYLNDSPGTVRHKCFWVFWGTIGLYIVGFPLLNIVFRILKLVSFSHFWYPDPNEKEYNFKNRAIEAGKDALRILATPFAIIPLALSCIYGLVRPYDGRKLYASIGRAVFGVLGFLSAPCFQPNPRFHALGGNIKERDVF